MGVELKEADIIVYSDDELKEPLIVVECKREDISELEFRRAVDQAFSYAVAEGAPYVWVTSRLKDEYYQVPLRKPKDRITIPDVPQHGVHHLAPYRFARGGGVSPTGQKLFDLAIVPQEELTKRFQQAHQALWGGGELNPSEAFDELGKLIFCKLRDERRPRKPGEPYEFQIYMENSRERAEKELLLRVKRLYEEGRQVDPEVFKDDIRLSPAKARTVVSYLESINLSETDLDSKGRAFETFMGSFFRGDFGQFFTPRPIVKFIVDVLPITNISRVLDTSCGSGGFLLHALDKVRREADAYYSPGSAAHFQYWHTFAEKNLFGIEINEQIARTAKMNMIIHDDGHTNVVAHDGLMPPADLRSRTRNPGFKEGSFDFIITNPPFGSIVKQTERAYMHQYRFATKDVDWLNPNSRVAARPSQSTEVLFIEQCWHYLAEGGYLAIVVPDSILSNGSLGYVREGIEDMFRIVAVVSMPQTAFAATGAGVKSSVLILRKHSGAQSRRIASTKHSLRTSVRREHRFEDRLKAIETEYKAAVKELRGFDNPDGLTGKTLKTSARYKAWRASLAEQFSERFAELRLELGNAYDERRREDLDDYDVFMAIAEDIGYDAAGRVTKVNELDAIAPELERFIHAIEAGRA
jgi:type I restriction-modification system DNA methylase subunit